MQHNFMGIIMGILGVFKTEHIGAHHKNPPPGSKSTCDPQADTIVCSFMVTT